MIQFYTYPKCSTCQKAKKWFEENGVAHESIHLLETPPSAEILKELLDKSGLEIIKFFNTGGSLYRELGLKDKVGEMSEVELLTLLASDGMLIKRPLVTDGEKVTLGFNEEVFEKAWL